MTKPDILARLKQAGRLKPSDFAQISQQLEERGGKPEDALLELSLLPEAELAYYLCEAYDLPFVSLDRVEVPPRALKLLGVDRLEADSMVPLSLDSQALVLAVANPARLPDLSPLAEYFQCAVRLVVATRSEIRAVLGRLRARSERSASALEVPQPAAQPSDTDMMRLLGRLLLEASRGHATQVHVNPSAEGLELRFRRDGLLEDRLIALAQADQVRLIDLVKRLAGLDVKDRRTPRSGRMRLPVGDREDRRDLTLHVACAPALAGERLTLSVVEVPELVPSLEQLGFSGAPLARLRGLLQNPVGGLLLVAGPSRSGRSTTLRAALGQLPADGLAVFSIEDPVEQRLPGVSQMQVDGAATSVPGLIRSAVEQDADVVMVNALADAESVNQALSTAFGGRFVLAGLTAMDAASAIQALFAMGAEPFLLGSSLRAVVSQRLVRRLCVACRRPVYRMPEEVVRLKDRLRLSGTTLFEPAGCGACGYRGFWGRMAIHEVLPATAQLAQALQERIAAAELARLLDGFGHRTLLHDGFSKALEGSTTFYEVQRVVATIAPGVV
ncbi:MAG: Flp pilus assembly complex ATPase component TadA [Candidatus Wallbacteria bacterium]|nr:Flp pilus assembly complex ATPase component TadA [Candidatus Wallbacteria bacterium]